MFGNGSQSPWTRCALPGLGIEATEAQIPGLWTMPFPLPTAAVATDQAPGSTGNGHVCVPAAGLLQRLALSGGAEPPSP